VILADETDWTELEERVEHIRMSKLKSAAGRPPHLRALTGGLLLKATRDMTWREAEDLIRHYAPARYLCGLTETNWSPDFTTLHDFAVLLGEDGVKLINEYAVSWAVKEKLADPRVLVADTTAQEAAIPYPNEMGLMAAFMSSLATASKKAGRAMKNFGLKAAKKFTSAKEKLRHYRLFTKTKAARLALLTEMASLVEQTQQQLVKAVVLANKGKDRLKGYSKVAQAKALHLHKTMKKLLPQIRYWLKTGRVAADKIINMHIPELYSVVRGKIAKPVEFGLQWGIRRLRGGFLLATVAQNRRELVDIRFAVQAVKDHIGLFGKPPEAYGYDRAGYSDENIARLEELGVKAVGLAPRGKRQWAVDKKMKEKLVRERAQVEGGIGSIKNPRYGFNRPRARSRRMMATYGQMAVLGFNINKLIRGLAGRMQMQVIG
jgi:IS5 family transposase